MLRGDFHHHIDADPIDGRFVRHSAGALIDQAVANGLNVLAITCHESIPYDGDVTRYAAARDVLLLRGMEATVEGHHVLLINFREWPSGKCTMADVQARKTPDSLVIAPHPFYPAGIAGGDTLAAYRSTFDAVEFSGMYTPLTKRFNRQAQEFARASALPVVGNTDTHFLWQLGYTYTRIDAAPDPHSVIDAIRHGRVEVVTQPLTWVHVVRFIVRSHSTHHALRDGLIYLAKVLRRTRRAERKPLPTAIFESPTPPG